MTRGAKRIDPSFRPQIDSLKAKMRHSSAPFDGSGYPFKQALAELKKEGVEILHDKEKCRYYNPKTVSDIWGYQ